MSNVDVIGLFKQAALEVHGRELGALDAATDLSTLGLDSVAVMEMTGCLEEKLQIRIPDEELAARRAAFARHGVDGHPRRLQLAAQLGELGAAERGEAGGPRRVVLARGT